MTGRPVVGVLPYVADIGLPEEDSLALRNGLGRPGGRHPESNVVVRLKYIANFTDFDPFLCEPDVHLLFSTNPSDIENADMVILPGSKNTVKDLFSLKEQGLDRSIVRAFDRGVQIVAICGGYQMAGEKDTRSQDRRKHAPRGRRARSSGYRDNLRRDEDHVPGGGGGRAGLPLPCNRAGRSESLKGTRSIWGGSFGRDRPLQGETSPPWAMSRERATLLGRIGPGTIAGALISTASSRTTPSEGVS